MKKVLRVLCVLLFLIVLITFIGCSGSIGGESIGNTNIDDKRVSLIYGDSYIRIYVDNSTGVQYMDGHGTCVMVDRNGYPLIYDNYNK